MAGRASNPVRSIRWGAVVLLAMAGTVVTMVVAEWPLTGETIARHAVAPRQTIRHAPVRATDLSLRGTFMPLEPDPFATVPPLLVSGGAAEGRRELTIAAESTPPTRTRTLWSCIGRPLEVPVLALNDYIEWQKGTSLGRVVEEAMPSGAAMFDADGPLSTGDAWSLRELTGGDWKDLSRRLAAAKDDDKEAAAVFDVRALAELEGSDLWNGGARGAPARSVASSRGTDAALRWSNSSMVRVSALSDAPGTDHDYLDLRLEQVWRFGADAWLSLGWRHMRGIITNERPTPTLRDDSILLELKLGF